MYVDKSHLISPKKYSLSVSSRNDCRWTVTCSWRSAVSDHAGGSVPLDGWARGVSYTGNVALITWPC